MASNRANSIRWVFVALIAAAISVIQLINIFAQREVFLAADTRIFSPNLLFVSSFDMRVNDCKLKASETDSRPK